MSDLISRESVIEIIESVCSADDSYWKPDTLEKIRNLSTHQTPSNTLGALDCVDRAEVIKAVKFYETFCDPYPRVVEALEDLPSVQPRKGKWTRHFDGNEWYWYCSSCKEQWYEEDLWMGGNSFPNFCPNCGADMRGEQDD